MKFLISFLVALVLLISGPMPLLAAQSTWSAAQSTWSDVPLPLQVVQSNLQQQIVMYNTKSHKYHTPSCIWAERYTKNCIPISRNEAIQRGGIPCKVCGG